MSPQDVKSTKYDDDDDEYTFDDLDGFDLDSIPWLCATQPATQDQQSSQSHQLTAQPTDHSTPQNAASALPHVVDTTSSHEPSTSTLPESSAAPTETVQGESSDSAERSTTPSTDYGLEDDVDDEFLKAVDKLETELLSRVKQSTSAPAAASSSTTCPTNLTATTSRSVWQTNGIPLQPRGVAPRCTPAYSQQREPVAASTPQKRQLCEDKNEAKANRTIVVSSEQVGRDEDGRSQKKVKQLLEDFEEEITCPICFDLFACAYLFNPCGHSYCGDCALGWMEKNKDNPVCAVCRTRVNKRGSMIANIALDNAVQRHVDALAENGDVGWQQGGEKHREWMKRKEEWKIGGIKRMADVMKTRKSRRR